MNFCQPKKKKLLTYTILVSQSNGLNLNFGFLAFSGDMVSLIQEFLRFDDVYFSNFYCREIRTKHFVKNAFLEVHQFHLDA